MEGSKRVSILRIVKITAVFIGGFIFACVLIVVFLFANLMTREMKERNIIQARLLCGTDHQVLLEACWELSRRVSAGDLESGNYYIRTQPDHQASQFPQVILDLAPNYVFIDENDSGRVVLEMRGGLDHFGVTAYTEDYMESGPKHEYGDRELIPGLWYYDNGYFNNPEYDKKIDELIKEHKK